MFKKHAWIKEASPHLLWFKAMEPQGRQLLRMLGSHAGICKRSKLQSSRRQACCMPRNRETIQHSICSGIVASTWIITSASGSFLFSSRTKVSQLPTYSGKATGFYPRRSSLLSYLTAGLAIKLHSGGLVPLSALWYSQESSRRCTCLAPDGAGGGEEDMGVQRQPPGLNHGCAHNL